MRFENRLTSTLAGVGLASQLALGCTSQECVGVGCGSEILLTLTNVDVLSAPKPITFHVCERELARCVDYVVDAFSCQANDRLDTCDRRGTTLLLRFDMFEADVLGNLSVPRTFTFDVTARLADGGLVTPSAKVISLPDRHEGSPRCPPERTCWSGEATVAWP